MAEKKMTRKEALATLIEIAEEWKVQNFVTDAFADNHTAKAIEVAKKMYAQITKPRKPDTKKHDANVVLGEQFTEAWNEETFKAADVAQVLGVSKPKANAICKAMGWEEVPSTESVKVYAMV